MSSTSVFDYKHRKKTLIRKWVELDYSVAGAAPVQAVL